MGAWFFSRVLFLAALLCGLPSLAASRCDVDVATQRVDLAQVSLAYQSIGRASDPALLLVMGLGGQLIHWPDEVVVALCQQGFRVIRYDNRDVGLSTWRQAPAEANLTFEVLRYKLGLPVSAPYTLTDMADDGLGLMDALHIEQFHVLGASMGGMIAQHMAAMAPRRVESLTLIMSTSGAEGLPAPSAALLQLLARRGAPNREVALEQQADLLAALGSPAVTDDRQALLQQAALAYDRAFNPEGAKRQILAILAEPSGIAQPATGAGAGRAWHGRSVVAGDAWRAPGGAFAWQPVEVDTGVGPSFSGSVQGAVAGGSLAVPARSSRGHFALGADRACG